MDLVRFPADTRTTAKGAWAEMIVTADLTAKGFEVFRAIDPGASCDLITLLNGETKRIQVKYRPTGATYTIPEYESHRFDLAAFVDQYAQVVYVVNHDMYERKRFDVSRFAEEVFWIVTDKNVPTSEGQDASSEIPPAPDTLQPSWPFVGPYQVTGRKP